MEALVPFGVTEKSEMKFAVIQFLSPSASKGDRKNLRFNSEHLAIVILHRFVLYREEQVTADDRCGTFERLAVEVFSMLGIYPPWQPTRCKHQLANDFGTTSLGD